MAGKIKPLKTGQGALIKLIDQQIEEQELMRDEIRREIRRYWKACQQNSQGTTGIDYSQDKVSGGSLRLCFSDAVNKIEGLQANLEKILDTVAELKKKRKKLIEIYKKNKTTAGKVFYYREVMGVSQEKTAKELGYSLRQIQRIERKLKEEFGVRF